MLTSGVAQKADTGQFCRTELFPAGLLREPAQRSEHGRDKGNRQETEPAHAPLRQHPIRRVAQSSRAQTRVPHAVNLAFNHMRTERLIDLKQRKPKVYLDALTRSGIPLP